MVNSNSNVDYSMVALSPRGYWKSRGRPSEAGIQLDAQATLQWVFSRYDPHRTRVVLWGQSIGAGVATTALATFAGFKSLSSSTSAPMIRGLVLETPFVNLRSMLFALYPQKYLPYRYLHPFLRSTWDSKGALELIANSDTSLQVEVLILQAQNDEVVSDGQAEILEKTCRDGGLIVERKRVKGALHNDVTSKGEGKMIILDFLKRIYT